MTYRSPLSLCRARGGDFPWSLPRRRDPLEQAPGCPIIPLLRALCWAPNRNLPLVAFNRAESDVIINRQIRKMCGNERLVKKTGVRRRDRPVGITR